MVIIVIDFLVYVAIALGVIVRLVLMRGSFVLPTFYRRDDEMSFNLGSISTVIIGFVTAVGLMSASPELFANPFVAFISTYTAPQLVDAVITSGARNFMEVEDDIQDDEVA